ncbi:MFS transporter [Rhizobiaceae bacterium BDR2-2]|uniref:MFS transporter n=1 Tax=Ectorhizobium quercum TaxID=2965071 RepID=A0AAE3SXW9_9HYPH|nr:MFS transporter [Ectorhizobium quercum]MCX8999549.1 MFS transporter [Ectorhizobium quercum]
MGLTIEKALDRAGAGMFQRRLIGIFGFVWAADAMQVLAVGFTAPLIAVTFGLSVPEALQTGTLFFLGMLIGAALFGRLADRFGRRRILILTVSSDAVFGLASVFAPDFISLLALRFLTGMAVGGTLPVDYAMMAEFLPAKNRGRWLVALEGFWSVGTVAVALAAWAVSIAVVEDGWRFIFAATALPAIFGLGLRFLVPESPMFLLKTGRVEEARAVVDEILADNGRQPLRPYEKLVLPEPAPRISIFSGPLRRRTATMLTIWFLVSVSYYGIFTWLPARLATGEGFGFVRGYGFLVLVALAQVPGYVLAAYGVEKWGRRPTLAGFLAASALGCLLFILTTATPVLLAASIMLMSFALLGSWGALYAYTPELYPTTARATGMGAAGAVARLGGLLAPSVFSLVAAQNLSLAIALFACFLAASAVIALFIGVETREQALT